MGKHIEEMTLEELKGYAHILVSSEEIMKSNNCREDLYFVNIRMKFLSGEELTHDEKVVNDYRMGVHWEEKLSFTKHRI